MIRGVLLGLVLALRPPAPGAAAPAGAGAPAAGPALVAVPGGTFRAGARVGPLADTAAYHRVAPFLLDATEVTVAEYAACVRAGRCSPAGTAVRWEGLTPEERARWAGACNGDRADRADHPVNCVDWDQAKAYCAFVGKRLPTEAEWEWAARNGEAATAYPWGGEPPGERACWSGAAPGPLERRRAGPAADRDLSGGEPPGRRDALRSPGSRRRRVGVDRHP